MFDFPSSPVNNQQYKAPSGQTYVFNGVAWLLSSGPPTTGVVTGDNPPPAPVPGMLWFQSSTGNTYIWYVDVDSAAWVQFNVGPPVVAGFIQQQIITATGAITLNAATRAFQVEVQGGGAGGGASGATSAGQAGGGGGGAAGGYCSKWILRPSGSYSPSCTVGAAGAAGGVGGMSQFLDGTYTMTAGGGAAGAASGGTVMGGGTGGNGPAATGGDINVAGQPGGWGLAVAYAGYAMARGGLGGNSRFGTGANGQVVINNVANAATGIAGSGYGSGGSGGVAINGNVATTGGVGTAGCVVITEYR